ncbi:MAG TPA: nucleotide pyrophosphatase/phosphodiesterase family protein [Stackebrandtia sp.]|jgi:predicted AlkP superfamily pyrophosphatase or phosphodiesterase|uniref:alkaline phosphatase family protein n=1 Tax=Stackebrandtia sp. TaxID=2023065 RepID=UPI002D71EB72|nr:alkaline phosphatase family protein [Stackebrandtia sp.]HZE41311.1 nucleotide pyrophosphatase/phosphodiesterase family protein [Stackebrandtia sp.]
MEFDATLFQTSPPQYGSASLADVIPSALSILDVNGERDILGLAAAGLGDARRIAVLLVDGLGYHLLPEAAKSSPQLATALDGTRGTLRELTTNFPSTTPTSLASLSVGVPPGQHGLMGFTVNVPGTDDILTHIAWHGAPDPLTWQPRDTCYTRASAAGVATTVVSRHEYARSGLTDAIFRGAEIARASSIPETVAAMRDGLARGDRSLVYGYFPYVDKTGHADGPGTDSWHDAVGELDGMLDRLLDALPGDTAVLLTADHGMIGVDDDSRVNVADHPHLRDGVRLIAGEPRVRYVHTHPGATADVLATWTETLGDRARVCTRAEAIDAGWFGPVTEAHAQRIGDVVAICRDRTVLLGVPESDFATTVPLRGYHGGLTAAEMAIPLWIAR